MSQNIKRSRIEMIVLAILENMSNGTRHVFSISPMSTRNHWSSGKNVYPVIEAVSSLFNEHPSIARVPSAPVNDVETGERGTDGRTDVRNRGLMDLRKYRAVRALVAAAGRRWGQPTVARWNITELDRAAGPRPPIACWPHASCRCSPAEGTDRLTVAWLCGWLFAVRDGGQDKTERYGSPTAKQAKKASRNAPIDRRPSNEHRSIEPTYFAEGGRRLQDDDAAYSGNVADAELLLLLLLLHNVYRRRTSSFVLHRNSMESDRRTGQIRYVWSSMHTVGGPTDVRDATTAAFRARVQTAVVSPRERARSPR